MSALGVIWVFEIQDDRHVIFSCCFMISFTKSVIKRSMQKFLFFKDFNFNSEMN